MNSRALPNPFHWLALASLLSTSALMINACAQAPDATPCVPQTTGVLSASDPTLVSVNDEVASIEKTSPSLEDLRQQIITSSANYGLSSPDLRALTEGLLARSPLQSAPQSLTMPANPPTPTPASSSTPAAVPAPYPLHASIVAFVTHKQSAAFAQKSEELAFTAKQAKPFADHFLTSSKASSSYPAETFAAYVKFYHFAVAAHGLSLNPAQARAFSDQVFFGTTKGPQIALTYMDVFNREQDYGAPASAAVLSAGQATCVSGP